MSTMTSQRDATPESAEGGRRADRPSGVGRDRLWSRPVVSLAQLGVLVAALTAWEFLPKIEALRNFSPVFDPFFVSSPSQIATRLTEMAVGGDGQPLLWSYLLDTLLATFIGVVVGTLLGAVVGLVLSNSPNGQRVARPFVTFFNATPRVALIPIFVIIAGPSLMASVLTAIVTVFFLVFYNAFTGGLSVPRSSVQNARLLGASRREIMRYVRLPYVMVWTFASLPNAISFGLVAVVTAEVLTGRSGMGQLLFASITSVQATLTFCVVVVLAVVGVVLVTASDACQRRILHWWSDER